MVNREEQVELMKKTEALLERCCGAKTDRIEKELTALGFVQKGGDPATVMMEHAGLNLHLDIGLDETGNLHSYELLPFDELDKKQEKFRW